MKEFIGWELMQFTGLLDKNGKEIYEGDVIRWGAKKSKAVQWNNHRNGWNFQDHQKNYTPTILWEIIGNIYENPELSPHPSPVGEETK